MRYVCLALLLALAAVVFLFKFQNLDTATHQFLSASLLPLLVGAHGLGLLTGGVVLSLTRSWVHGATAQPPVRG